MKNIISIMLFVIAFSINANAQQSENAAKKENCCAMPCDMACCNDATCDMACCDMASCDMAAAGCPMMAASAGCAASASCADKASADSNAAAMVAAQSDSCTAEGKPACCGAKEPVRKA